MEQPRLNGRGIYALPQETPIEVVAQRAYEALRNAEGDDWGNNTNTWYRTLTKRLEPGHGLSDEAVELYRTEVALGVFALLGKKKVITQKEVGSEELVALSQQLQTAIQEKNRAKAVAAACELAAAPQGIEYIMQSLEELRKKY